MGLIHNSRLTRRTELKRGKPPPRGKPPERGAPPRRLTPVKPVSDKRKTGRGERRRQVAAAFVRDGWFLVAGEWVGGRCIAAERGMPGPCGGKLTPHRLRKGSNPGGEGWRLNGYFTANVVACCARHNVAIEDDPPTARACGLVIQ